MDYKTFVLLFDTTSTGIEPLRKALAGRADQFRMQCVTDVPTALARIAGGGVDLILLSLQPAGSFAGDPLDDFLKLHEGAPKVPIVVVCDSYDESLAEKAMRKGAADYLIREAYEVDLLRVLGSTVAKIGRPPASRRSAPGSVRRGKVIACMGAKGGAGTSTVALNVATALTEGHSVILAELHPAFGTLAAFCQPHRAVQDVSHLLTTDRDALSPAEIESCLWPCKTAPGLQILFGPQRLDHSTKFGPEDARAILTALSALADYVVVDLPVSLGETNRAVLEDADVWALIVEQDPICIQSAKRILQAMDGLVATVPTGIAVVNRTGLVAPIQITYIQSELPVPILGVIPPAADLCAAAQNARSPLVKFDADSLAASSLRGLAKAISDYSPVIRHQVAAGL